MITDVQERPSPVPDVYAVHQNYPNPFNPTTIFDFSLPRNELVSLKVYDILGKEVAVVLHQNLASGRHKVKWNSSGLTSGIYFYRFQAGSFVQTRKLTILK